MAVIREYYMTRNDGVKIFLSYSDKDVYIRKEGTDLTDVEMYDVEDAHFVYVETDTPIETEAELTVADALAMLGEMGVNTDD